MRALFLFLFATQLFASTDNIERKIFATVINALFSQKTTVYVWSDDPEKTAILSKISKVVVTAKPSEAEIVFLKKVQRELPKKPLVFALDYRTLKSYKERLLGGFYWQKGRPNLVFFKQELHLHHIELPKEMQAFVESRAQ